MIKWTPTRLQLADPLNAEYEEPGIGELLEDRPDLSDADRRRRSGGSQTCRHSESTARATENAY